MISTRVLLASAVCMISTAPLYAAISDYQEVSCTTQPFFSANQCNQCFDGKGVKEKERVGGGNMYDMFANVASGTMQYVIYEDEHKESVAGIQLINLADAATRWNTSGAEWRVSQEILFVTDSGGTNPSRKVYFVQPGQKVKVTESVLGAGYTLESSTKNNGDYVGMVRFPVAYHEVTAGAEGPKKTHYECVAYRLDGKTATPPANTGSVSPVTPTPKPTGTASGVTVKPNPKDMTKTKTGPESLLLIAAAFFISFGLMFSLRRRA